jgi:hypothetical protein
MSYVTVDPIIHAWVVVDALTLFTEAGGGEARFVYSSSDRGECYQIAIAPPVAGQVVIHLWSIETFQDEELEEVLLSSVEDFARRTRYGTFED